MKQTSLKTLTARRDALLKQLTQVGPFIQGSFCLKRIKCGKPTCRCARGETHDTYVLTNKVRGKTVTTHVPRELCDEVRAWTQQYKRLKQLMAAISKLNDRLVRTHVRASRAAAANQKRARTSAPPTPTSGCSDTTFPTS
jgi:hypothetical protein